MKTCPRCSTPKERSEFYVNLSRTDGLQGWCKACVGESQNRLGPDGLTSKARWYQNNSAKQLEARRLIRYGISAESFNSLLAKQGGVCAICRCPQVSGRQALCTDHDHTTGKVRGLLCQPCNVAIGSLKDSARVATAAAEYLTLHGKL